MPNEWGHRRALLAGLLQTLEAYENKSGFSARSTDKYTRGAKRPWAGGHFQRTTLADLHTRVQAKIHSLANSAAARATCLAAGARPADGEPRPGCGRKGGTSSDDGAKNVRCTL